MADGAVSAAPTRTATAAVGADVCALVPADALRAAIGGHPGTGRPGEGEIDGGQCTWTVSSTHSALIPFTREPTAYLPSSIYWKPAKTVALHGVDCGRASPATHTICIVEDGTGVLFNDIQFRDVDRHAFVELGRAIAAKR